SSCAVGPALVVIVIHQGHERIGIGPLEGIAFIELAVPRDDNSGGEYRLKRKPSSYLNSWAGRSGGLSEIRLLLLSYATTSGAEPFAQLGGAAAPEIFERNERDAT